VAIKATKTQNPTKKRFRKKIKKVQKEKHARTVIQKYLAETDWSFRKYFIFTAKNIKCVTDLDLTWRPDNYLRVAFNHF